MCRSPTGPPSLVPSAASTACERATLVHGDNHGRPSIMADTAAWKCGRSGVVLREGVGEFKRLVRPSVLPPCAAKRNEPHTATCPTRWVKSVRIVPRTVPSRRSTIRSARRSPSTTQAPPAENTGLPSGSVVVGNCANWCGRGGIPHGQEAIVADGHRAPLAVEHRPAAAVARLRPWPPRRCGADPSRSWKHSVMESVSSPPRLSTTRSAVGADRHLEDIAAVGGGPAQQPTVGQIPLQQIAALGAGYRDSGTDREAAQGPRARGMSSGSVASNSLPVARSHTSSRSSSTATTLSPSNTTSG